MKKTLVYSILLTILLVIIITGATYSFFAASTTASNQAEATSKKFEVIYTGGTNISGPLSLVTKKEEGVSTTVNIKLAQNSAVAKGNIYINVEKITSNIAIAGFIWEVIGTQNGIEVYYNKGNFSGVNDTTNNIVNIVENYQLSEENTSFTVYLWIDGNQVDNSILNCEFQGYIGAKTENFSGITG